MHQGVKCVVLDNLVEGKGLDHAVSGGKPPQLVHVAMELIDAHTERSRFFY